MQTIDQIDCEARYPTPLIRGTRIARLGGKNLGSISTDAATFQSLGTDQIGWFAGGVPTYDRMIENARRINASGVGGRWIIVPATRFLADVAYQQWFEDGSFTDDANATSMWHDDLVTFSVPERLDDVARAIIEQDVRVAGIVLLDPACIVHRGRSFGKGKFRVAHDRPQLIVNFRSKLAIGNWCPPLIFMTLRKAGAVSTSNVARIYGLEAMHFVEGSTLRCGVIKNPSNVVAAPLVPLAGASH